MNEQIDMVDSESQAMLPVPIKEEPVALISKASDVANVCRQIVTSTAVNIQGKKYVKCEGWMSIATAHGCIAGSRDVKRVEGGWTAIGEIRRMSDGVVLSTAEGYVGKDEKRWGNADEYACRAMAQTRAISRACRAAFAHIVVMMDAGLSTTPAEEVPPGGFRDEPQPRKVQSYQPEKKTPPSTKAHAKNSVPASPQRCKDRFLERCQPFAMAAWIWAVQQGHILPTEELKDISPNKVPQDSDTFAIVSEEIQKVINAELCGDPEWLDKWKDAHDNVDVGPEPEPELPTTDIDWRSTKVPPYKDNSKTLGDLPKNKLFGYWANFEAVEKEYKGKTYPPTSADFALRKALDVAGAEMEFTKKD